MTAKEFLQQAYCAQQEVEMKLEQIARLKSLATRTTTNLKMAPGGKSEGSIVENAILQLDEQVRKLGEEVTELLKISDEVSKAISQVRDFAERRILKYRYLCFFSWQQISVLMKMSERQIFRLHGKAIENFSAMSVDVSRCQ